MRLQRISENIYMLRGFGSGVLGANIYLLVDNGVTLIDTGFTGKAGDILKAVRELGFVPEDTRRIIITHHHPDHTGSLARLKEATGAEVLAHAADAPYIDGRAAQPLTRGARVLAKMLQPLMWLECCAVDTCIEEGDELDLLGGMRVIHTPGHTPGSISLHFPGRGVLVVGDVIAHRFGLDLPARAYTVDMAGEVRSIKKLAALDFRTICFGHGRPILRQAREAIACYAATL